MEITRVREEEGATKASARSLEEEGCDVMRETLIEGHGRVSGRCERASNKHRSGTALSMEERRW